MSNVSRIAVSSLRKLISDGHLQPGEKLGEVQVADMLGVSRTPIRLAFRTLEQEGLLEKAGKQGFVVREFSREDVICGLEIRGVLEGLAARRMAEAGLSEETRAALQQCLDDADALFAQQQHSADDVQRWSDINARFHRIIVEGAGSRAIADAITRNSHLPFASSDSIIIDTEHLDKEFRKLHLAHLQHQMVFQALMQGESARVEMLMREHAYIGLRYGGLFGLPDALK